MIPMKRILKTGGRALVLAGCFFCVGLSPWQLETAAAPAPDPAPAVRTNEVTTVKTTEAIVVKHPRLTFGLDRVPGLQFRFLSVPLWQCLAALIYVGLGLLLAKLIDLILGVQLRKWAGRKQNVFVDKILGLIHGPIKVLAFVAFIGFGLDVFAWPGPLRSWVSRILTVLAAASITYVSLRLTDLLMAYWAFRAKAKAPRAFNDQLMPVVRNTLKAVLVIVGALVTMDILELPIRTMLASLSIGGLALGLAAQDTLANLFGAVAVFMDEPFRVGDRIQLDAIDGVVESIGLRSTRVRNLDGHLITVPNKTMGNATVTNITRRPNIKTVMNIGVTYDTPTKKLRDGLEILNQLYRGHPKTFDVLISFNKFADSSLNIQVVHWWNSTDMKEYLDGMQELNLAIKEKFEAAGINFAFPSQTVYLKQDSEWRLGSAETKSLENSNSPGR